MRLIQDALQRPETFSLVSLQEDKVALLTPSPGRLPLALILTSLPLEKKTGLEVYEGKNFPPQRTGDSEDSTSWRPLGEAREITGQGRHHSHRP